MTTITGKLGQSVGYILKNSNNKQTQAWRAYQSQVSNPKTVRQANQRLALKPINNFARALSPIIERGFEGVKYGAESRQKFMSLNMADFRGPFLVKGDERAVPGPFIISQGSLLPLSVSGTRGTGNAVGTLAITDLFSTGANLSAVGGFSKAIIDANSDIQEGDQLTFVFCYRIGDTFIYRYSSVVIDTSVTVTATEGAVTWNNILFVHTRAAGDTLARLDVAWATAQSDETLVAAAVIQSRDGDTRHLRSNATMYVTPQLENVFMSDQAFEKAVMSYTGTGSVIDWPTEKDGSAILNDKITYTISAADVLSAETATNWPQGVSGCAGFVTESGQRGLYVTRIGNVTYLLNQKMQRISKVVTSEDSSVTVYASIRATATDTQFGGYLLQVPFGAEVSA